MQERNRIAAAGQLRAELPGIPDNNPDSQAEATEIKEAEALERYYAAWDDPVLEGQRAAYAAAEAESEAIWQESRIGLSGAPSAEPEAEP